ncbi:aldehyde dehydrogenase family protein [Streptacidiphilus anmyonensis]|uniref:aldehyde dehydrogenase family protein n=1 Tax=Streptacidiphilus anmyonensis TaxID=405782 RepID=UPI0005A7FCC8|nr:aldehyde dehydrogenase family protein [Streptacidiphilus anmyonensis]
MTGPNYTGLVAAQRAYFLTGATRAAAWREEQLRAVVSMIRENREAMFDALWQDLRRNRFDADLMDVEYCAKEAQYALDHLHEWMKPERVHTPLVFEPGHVRVRRDPLGVCLIIGAWNEPYMLTLAPLVAAIAGGNTAVLKPSEISAACAQVTAEMVPRHLDPQAFAVVQGAIPETTALLEQHWDFIFFTGSPKVGRIIHQAAAKHLTPAVLELGGKNPTIVHASANVRSAARRIAFSRYINSGHICTAPDHVLVWPEVKDEFVAEMRDAIHDFYGEDPKQSPDYGRVIDDKSFARIAGYLDNGTVAVGGQTDPAERYIAPTVLVDVPADSPVMQEEVFGPVLPVLEIDSVQAVIDWVNTRPRPLGLYVFAEDDGVAEEILDATESGDAAVNDCSIHPLVPELPFGGVGNSGMGKYHGRFGFEAFTNARGVLYHGSRLDPGVKYPPYAEHERMHGVISKLMP